MLVNLFVEFVSVEHALEIWVVLVFTQQKELDKCVMFRHDIVRQIIQSYILTILSKIVVEMVFFAE